MRYFTLGLATLFLAGCSDDITLVVTRQTVVMPSDNMFECPSVTNFPESSTLTDLQVARLLVQLHQNNLQCKASIDAIQEFLTAARTRLERDR
jgi:uncharacterized protein YcfL